MNQHPRTAISGGTGLVGRHLAERLGPESSVIVSRRTGVATSDGVTNPGPRRMFAAEQIRSGLPEPGRFGWRDRRVSG